MRDKRRDSWRCGLMTFTLMAGAGSAVAGLTQSTTKHPQRGVVSALLEDPVDAGSSYAAILNDLQNGSTRGDGQRERAAFIVRSEEGEYRCAEWPSKHHWREASYNGFVPAGTIAIAHTHPRAFPHPSQHDVDEAIRTQLVSYVITFWSIYRIDPAGGRIVALVRNHDWTLPFRRKHNTVRLCAEVE